MSRIRESDWLKFAFRILELSLCYIPLFRLIIAPNHLPTTTLDTTICSTSPSCYLLPPRPPPLPLLPCFRSEGQQPGQTKCRMQTPSAAQELPKEVNPGLRLERNSLLSIITLVETISEVRRTEVDEDELHLSRRGISSRESAVDRLDVRDLEVDVDHLPRIETRESSDISTVSQKRLMSLTIRFVTSSSPV